MPPNTVSRYVPPLPTSSTPRPSTSSSEASKHQQRTLTNFPPELLGHILDLALGRSKGLERLSEEGVEEGWAGWGGVEDPRRTGWVGEREEGRRVGSTLTWHSGIKLLLPVCRLFYEILLPKLWEAPTIVSLEHGKRFLKALTKKPLSNHSNSTTAAFQQPSPVFFATITLLPKHHGKILDG
ncbi:hypothetical protein BT69DRAFT_872307 [Atractiella rhizophila]|nr:hypothetical protein BT69DRAFT_872307 [Atractiella rhizophila]